MLYLHSQIASEPSNAHFRFSFSFMSAYAFSLTSSSRIWVEHASNLFHHIHLYVQVYYSEFHWVPSATHFVFTHSTLGSCSLASPAAFSFLHYSTRCKAFSVFLLGLVSNAVPQMQSFQNQMFRCHRSCLLSIVSSITDTSKLFANAEKLGARWERPRISQIMGVKRELKGGKGIEYNRLRESKESQEGPQRFVLLYSLLLNHMPFTDSGTAMRHSVWSLGWPTTVSYETRIHTGTKRWMFAWS